MMVAIVTILMVWFMSGDAVESDQDLLPRHLSNLARNVPQFCPEVITPVLSLLLLRISLDRVWNIH